MNVHPDDMVTTPYRSFQYTLLQNLGLCVPLTPSLRSFFNVLYHVQIALCVFGTLGSALAVAVCLKRKLRSSCSIQLALLSSYDVVFLVVSLVMAVLGLEDAWGTSAAKVMMCVRTLALWGVAHTTLDICLERCLSVALPFLAHSRFTVDLALKKATLIGVSGLLFTLPFMLDLIHGYSVGDGCGLQRHLTTFGLVYTLYISLLLLYILPFLAIIVINVIFVVILCRMRGRSVRPKGESERCQQHQQLSVLVLGLSAWYVVSMLLPSLLFLVRLTRFELFQPEVDMRVAAVADTVVVLSCCSNFLFYFLLWRPFRQVVWRWVKRGWRRMCGGCDRERAKTYRTGLTATSSSSSSNNNTQPIAGVCKNPASHMDRPLLSAH